MHINRRQFALGSAGLLSTLGLMAEASAQSTSDYKALVCIFLYGANDQYNTLIPYDDATHALYYNIRKGVAVNGTPYEGIALPRNWLNATALSTPLSGGRLMAVNPVMPEIKDLFEVGRAAWMMNVGPLVVPTTLVQYNNKSVPLPPKLFSHNDQQAYWQSSAQTEGAQTGWGGRAADLMLSGNGKASLTCVSINGNALFLSGQSAFASHISSSGATTVNALRSGSLFGSSVAATALRTLMTQNPTTTMAAEYNQINRRALDTYDTLVAAIGTTPGAAMNNWFTTASSNTLSAQLKVVARLIEARATLGVKRQVFLVGMGGFDLHDNLPAQHPGLLQKLSQASKEFDDAMVGLGLSKQVTSFTASDFGRTLASNGDGSDHGWGSHHLVMGGAVKGKTFYGIAPEIGLTHSQQVGSGRLLPSTSIDQMGAELARWLGVSTSDMAIVLPNAGNFDLYKLGLMATTA